MIKSINRTDVVRKVAKDLGITIKQTSDICEEAEKVIIQFLKEREQVRIHEFGTFYQTLIKSHVIKQIRTKTPRIVLEQKSLKFRPSPILKDAIYQRTRKKRIQSAVKSDSQVKIKTSSQGNIQVKYEPTLEKPKTNISFKPFGILPRVDSAEIQRKIKDRLEKLSKAPLSDKPKEEIARETEIFLKLLTQIKKTGAKSIDFSLDESKDVRIFAGRPRRQMSHLPKEIIKGFLTYIDIEELHLPQYRHKLIFAKQPGYDKINIEIHCFPTKTGASIHIDIK